MEKAETIYNLSDFKNFWGVEESCDEETLSRAVYKNTECGAWCKIIDHVTVKKQERWVAILTPDGDKVSVQSVKQINRLADINDHSGYVEPSQAPREVRMFLSLDYFDSDPTNNTMMYVNGWEHIKEIVRADDLKEFNLRLKNTALSFKIKVSREEKTSGVTIGSIVEGSDASCEPFDLIFPFKRQLLEHAISRLEDEADYLWACANRTQIDE